MSKKYQRQIYTLDDLTPEVKAVTFAKCSRSPKSFREIADELTEEKSSKFHEKWVVGYGHSSVAEHAVLSIAMENVSILATKVIEDNRLASYTEVSTRYQVIDRGRYFRPAKIMKSEFGKLYEETADFLFDTYTKLLPGVDKQLRKKFPRKSSEPEKMYEGIMKAKVCDVLRMMLPIATLTNLGMTVNARTLEYALSKMLSHPLEEIKNIGEEVKKVSKKITPTLIKYAEPNEYLDEANRNLSKYAQEYLGEEEDLDDEQSVVLVDYDREAENKIVAAMLYKFSHGSYKQALEKVKSLNRVEKEKIIDDTVGKMGKFDSPLREFELADYTFEIVIDYGAFRDLQRHRMCTQTNQLVTTEHGYTTPDEIKEFDLEKEFTECMKRSQTAFEKISERFPLYAQYIVALAFRKRTLFNINLRSLYHLIKLRSSTKGHISYRRVAQKMYDEIERVQPLLAKYIKVTKDK